MTQTGHLFAFLPTCKSCTVLRSCCCSTRVSLSAVCKPACCSSSRTASSRTSASRALACCACCAASRACVDGEQGTTWSTTAIQQVTVHNPIHTLTRSSRMVLSATACASRFAACTAVSARLRCSCASASARSASPAAACAWLFAVSRACCSSCMVVPSVVAFLVALSRSVMRSSIRCCSWVELVFSYGACVGMGG